MRLREPAGTALIVFLIILLISYEAYNAKSKKKELPTDTMEARRSKRRSS